MTVLTEDLRRIGAFLISEAEHYRSRETVTVEPGNGVTYSAGTVLGMITVSKKYVIYNPGNSDGSQNVAGVLFEAVTGTVAAPSAKRAIIARSAQVKKGLLTWFTGATAPQITTGSDALKAIGIISRQEA